MELSVHSSSAVPEAKKIHITDYLVIHILNYIHPKSGSDLHFGLPPEDCDTLLDALVSALRENRNGRHWHPTVSANSSAALDTISMQVMASEDDDEEDDN